MTRLRILLKIESADAYELKAQALNRDARLKDAGISALKFTGDKHYIADGEFVPEPPSTAQAKETNQSKSDSANGRLRVILRMSNDDSYELKAQALNNDPRLKNAGISALKFVGDEQFIADGEFSPNPPSIAPDTDSTKPKSDSITDEKIRVVLRMSNDDSYELKAQALNNDPRLKNAGISALKFAGEKQFIKEGEFSPESSPPSPASKQGDITHKKVRVTLRVPRKDAYKFIASFLNNDPDLKKAGISGVELVKGAGMIPVPKELPAKPQARKPSFLRLALITAVVWVIGVVSVLAIPEIMKMGLPPFLSPATPTQTIAVLIPVSGGEMTSTNTVLPPTETNVPPTNTLVPTQTKTLLPTATNSHTPTATIYTCEPPTEAAIVAENLSCRYGPGGTYLYRAGLRQGDVVDVLGRAETAFGTWIRVETRWQTPARCWISASPKYVDIPQDDIACLDPLYPDKAPLIIFNTDLFPKPTNVSASRLGNMVYIYWEGFDLLPGDRPVSSPRYLVETWTCQDGEYVFTPQGWEETSASVRDDGGCGQASRGYVYMAHVDGYIGPVTIPWPP